MRFALKVPFLVGAPCYYFIDSASSYDSAQSADNEKKNDDTAVDTQSTNNREAQFKIDKTSFECFVVQFGDHSWEASFSANYRTFP